MLDYLSFRTRPPTVRVQDFVGHVAELHRDSDYGFASEFSVCAFVVLSGFDLVYCYCVAELSEIEV